MGGPMLFGEEPRKQKTRRPERRGITRAVSPKKIGRERKECPSSGASERRNPESVSARSKVTVVSVLENVDDGAVSGDHFRFADNSRNWPAGELTPRVASHGFSRRMLA